MPTPTGGRSCWRDRILSALREWFRRRGFPEVATRAQVSPATKSTHAFATERPRRAAPRADVSAHLAGVHLQEAPGRGKSRVFSLHVYRNRERGPLHHPEFTMLEWYRTNEPYEALMADLRHPGGSGQGGRLLALH
jgi:lysyl-tRNA synthetase class 2